ncbi:hypothetical protein SLEP1_g40367 [Rubroshorea leprosula]|uniref:TIR domain-containing protein n=1 Tax=Rubroshorea leprosula TaxID=152421 RepID=A0AAV5L369_9ROSI|nr:hypothetical protein SLEP1_g40367 [Rubroshorea leprosula]
MAASFPSNRSRDHHVFLSFRGEDVRKTFLGHLCSALKKEGFRTYKDDNELERGSDIAPSLLEAIEHSRIAIVVFSENYADSRWCLDELVKILDCRDKLGQNFWVLPVFFHVDPSDVRNQRGIFGKAFACHQNVTMDKVERWKTALTDAANIAGFDLQSVNGDESELIEKIIENVRQKVHHTCLGKRKMFEKGSFPEDLVIERAPARGNRIPTEDLVGEISTKEEIWGYLMGDEVGMIGVCGIGGVGKTTIMKNLHNDLLRETRFQKVIWVTVSHLPNVFELQKKIAGAMGKRLLNDDKDDDGVMMRAGELMDIMEGVKFVVILDDVWEKFSLKEVGIPDPKAQNGCKVVVTSRSIEVCSYMSLRDMAIISIGPEFGYMIKAGMNLVELPDEHGWVEDPKKLSLMANNILKVPLSLSPKCSTLLTLILSSNSNLSEIPESFFGEMLPLKVLDLSSTAVETLPTSISKLKNLSTLRLQLCKKLKYLPSLANLKGLKKLDLHRAGIEVVPQGMGMLISLEYLDLLFCPNLKEIPTGILLNLSSLQYLAVCCLRETTIVRNFEEVARLKKLETLECNFDDIQDLNYFVNKFKDFQRAIAYSLLVGSAKDMRRKSKHELAIIDCEIGEECIMLPNKLEYLWIRGCKNMGSSLSKIALSENANELRACDIDQCAEIECVVELDSSSSSSSLRCPVFDKLEELRLHGLPRKLLPLELLHTLQNLEAITVTFCDQIEDIIASLDSDASSSDKFTFTFPKLRELHLSYLPQLKSICSAKGVMVCNSIEKITISVCPELKRIPVQLPQLDNGQPSPPPHLREIKIRESSKEWWESVEWDHPNAKNLLQPFLKYST